MSSFLSGKKTITELGQPNFYSPCLVNTQHIAIVIPEAGGSGSVAICVNGDSVQLDIAFSDLQHIVETAQEEQIQAARARSIELGLDLRRKK